MPLAKSAPQPVTEVSKPQITQVDGVMVYDNLPIDVANYFDVDIFRLSDQEKQRLRDIHTWARNKTKDGTLGDIISKISELERQLGATAINEKRSDRLWRWCKLSFRIDDLDKQRQALERRRWL